MEHLAEVIAGKMNLKKNVKRMDSLMVASRCKAMSRLEIIYTCVADMVRLLHRLGMDEFMSDYLESQPEHAAEDNETVIVDGAYASYENSKLAEEKNITLVPTALSGKDPDEIYADFELSDDETKVVKCPMGYAPVSRHSTRPE